MNEFDKLLDDAGREAFYAYSLDGEVYRDESPEWYAEKRANFARSLLAFAACAAGNARQPSDLHTFWSAVEDSKVLKEWAKDAAPPVVAYRCVPDEAGSKPRVADALVSVTNAQIAVLYDALSPGGEVKLIVKEGRVVAAAFCDEDFLEGTCLSLKKGENEDL